MTTGTSPTLIFFSLAYIHFFLIFTLFKFKTVGLLVWNVFALLFLIIL